MLEKDAVLVEAQLPTVQELGCYADKAAVKHQALDVLVIPAIAAIKLLSDWPVLHAESYISNIPLGALPTLQTG